MVDAFGHTLCDRHIESHGFIGVSLATSLMTTFLCCQSRTKWTSVKYIVRTLAFTVPFFVNSFPYIYRLCVCEHKLDCDTTNLSLYLHHALFQFLGALANVAKFPERFIPEKFDATGQSHHIMHIFLPYACDTKLTFIRSEYAQRREVLEQHIIQPSVYTTLGIMGLAIILNLAIAFLTDPVAEKKKTN